MESCSKEIIIFVRLEATTSQSLLFESQCWQSESLRPTIADIDVGGKHVTNDQFMRSMEFVDVKGHCDIMPAITFVGESRQDWSPY